MKVEALRDMTKDELVQKLRELKDDLFNLRMRKTLKELDNPLRLRTIRRDIARIETILSEDRLSIKNIVDKPLSILDRHQNKEGSQEKDKDAEQDENADKNL